MKPLRRNWLSKTQLFTTWMRDKSEGLLYCEELQGSLAQCPFSGLNWEDHIRSAHIRSHKRGWAIPEEKGLSDFLASHSVLQMLHSSQESSESIVTPPNCRFKGLKEDGRQQGPRALPGVTASPVWDMDSGPEYQKGRILPAPTKKQSQKRMRREVIAHGFPFRKRQKPQDQNQMCCWGTWSRRRS